MNGTRGCAFGDETATAARRVKSTGLHLEARGGRVAIRGLPGVVEHASFHGRCVARRKTGGLEVGRLKRGRCERHLLDRLGRGDGCRFRMFDGDGRGHSLRHHWRGNRWRRGRGSNFGRLDSRQFMVNTDGRSLKRRVRTRRNVDERHHDFAGVRDRRVRGGGKKNQTADENHVN